MIASSTLAVSLGNLPLKPLSTLPPIWTDDSSIGCISLESPFGGLFMWSLELVIVLGIG